MGRWLMPRARKVAKKLANSVQRPPPPAQSRTWHNSSSLRQRTTGLGRGTGPLLVV